MTNTKVRCPNCDSTLNLQTQSRSGKYRCPACEQVVRLHPAVIPTRPAAAPVINPTPKVAPPVQSSEHLNPLHLLWIGPLLMCLLLAKAGPFSGPRVGQKVVVHSAVPYFYDWPDAHRYAEERNAGLNAPYPGIPVGAELTVLDHGGDGLAKVQLTKCGPDMRLSLGILRAQHDGLWVYWLDLN